MIPVNSVLQVGHFPEIMQAEIDRRFTPVHHPDPHAPAPAGNFQAILIRSNTKLPEALVKQIPSIRMVSFTSFFAILVWIQGIKKEDPMMNFFQTTL